MKNKGKRIKHFTINLTEEDGELLERVAEELDRNPSNLGALLLVRALRKQWESMQPEGEPFTIPTFNQ